jgi:hypothetical protein
MSDKKAALGYLEAVHRAAFRHLRVQPGDLLISTRDLKGEFRAAGYEQAQLESLDPSPREYRRTAFENPHDYAIVQNAVRAAQDAILNERGSHDVSRLGSLVTFGTIPTDDPGYAVVSVPGTGHFLALLSSGVLRFSYLLSKIAAHALDYGRRPDQAPAQFFIEDFIDRGAHAVGGSRPEIATRFHELLVAAAICGHAMLAPPYAPRFEVLTTAARLTDTIVCFIVAHVLTHLLEGHLLDAQPAPRTLGDLVLEERVFDAQAEVAADLTAANLMARAGRSRTTPSFLTTWAPVLFLTGTQKRGEALELLRRRETTGAEGEQPASAALADRVANLLALAHAGSRPWKEATWIREFVETLWQGEREAFLRAHSLGFAPGTVPRPRQCNGLTPMVYEDSGTSTVPFSEIRDQDRALAIADFLSGAGQARFAEIARASVRGKRDFAQEGRSQRLGRRRRDVVICYRASLFLDNARRVASRLRMHGVRAIHDELLVIPGDAWEPALEAAIGEARLVVFLLNPMDPTSDNAGPHEPPLVREIRWAADRGVPVFVVLAASFAVNSEGHAMALGWADVAFGLAARKPEVNFPCYYLWKELNEGLSEADEGLIVEGILAYLGQHGGSRPGRAGRPPRPSVR